MYVMGLIDLAVIPPFKVIFFNDTHTLFLMSALV